jgi:Protein of unknown function (DUF4238)
MSRLNERQHYISRVLLERFRIPGNPLQCYQIETGEWKPRSVEKACAAIGYNQLLAFGDLDDSLEEAFSKIESRAPQTFRELEKIAEGRSGEIPSPVYDNMCWYLAFLKLSSLPAKAAAVVNFIFQLNFEIDSGQRALTRELQIPEDTISYWKKECADGQKVIIDPENVLQLIYRNQFRRSYANEFILFRDTQWSVSVSPIELPMSDVGVVPIHLSDEKANHYILSIGPHTLLEGIFSFDLSKNVPRRPVRRLRLSAEQMEYPFDAICSSAVLEIVCSQKLAGIPESLVRAKRRGIQFHRIADAQAARSAGLKRSAEEIRFRVVSREEYVRFMHSFIQPPVDATR